MELSPHYKATEFSLNELDLFQSRTGNRNMEEVLMQYRNLVKSQVEIETERLAEAKAAFEKENISLKSRLAELESKNNIMSGELLIISNLLQERSHYESTIRQLRDHLEKTMSEDKGLLSNSNGHQQFNNLQSQQLMSDNVLLHQQNEVLRGEISSLKKIVEDLRGENDRLLNTIETRYSSPDNSGGFTEASMQHHAATPTGSKAVAYQQNSSSLVDMRFKLNSIRSSMLTNEAISIEFDAERLAFETTIEHLRKRVAELEKRSDQLTSENLMWKQVYNLREKNLDVLTARYQSLEKELKSQITALRKENEKKSEEISLLREEEIRIISDRNIYDAQLKQLKTMNDNQKEELSRMNDLMASRKKDWEDLSLLWEKTRVDNQKLVEENNNLKHEMMIMTERCELLSLENNEHSRLKENYKEQAERVALELTKKNKDLVEKINSLKEIRGRYEFALLEACQVLDNRMPTTGIRGSAGKTGPPQQKDVLQHNVPLKSPRNNNSGGIHPTGIHKATHIVTHKGH